MGNRRGSGGNADHRIRAASTSRRSSGLPAMGGARLRSGAGHSLSSRRSPARRAAFTATAPRSEARAQASGPDRSCCTAPPRAPARPVAWRPGRAPAVPCAERLGACVTVPHRACEAGRPLPFAQSLPPPARTPPADDPRETLHCPDATAECRCAPGRQPQRAACASILSRRNRRCGHTLILHCSPHRVDAKNRRPILKNVSYGPFDRRQLPRGGRHAARASQTCQEHSVRPHARARCALQLCGW